MGRPWTINHGPTPEIRHNDSHIQWKYSNETEWHNLIDINSLKGIDGTNGTDGTDGKDAGLTWDGTTLTADNPEVIIQLKALLGIS